MRFHGFRQVIILDMDGFVRSCPGLSVYHPVENYLIQATEASYQAKVGPASKVGMEVAT